MLKSQSQAQVSKTDKPKARSVKPKKKLIKRPANAKKVDKTPKQPKVTKPKVEKSVTNRKINVKPVLAKTTGINISPAKVKNIVSNYVLNKDSYSVLKELKEATPRKITKTVEGKEVVEDFKGTPVAQLSKETLDYVAYATECFEKSQRDEYAKNKISKMQEPQRKAYYSAKSAAKDKFDKESSDDAQFDVEVFNKQYDPQFYVAYAAEQKARQAGDSSDEWKRAVDKVTKLKNRFSTNSRVFLSALVECLIKQIVLNGTVCCVADKKKIIQLSHILDTSKEGFEERFPLYPLITNLNTFKQAQKYLVEQSVPKKDESSSEESESESKPQKTTDVFTLGGVDLDKQYQFRYYIGETCREVRMDLADTKTEGCEIYNYTSVSKIFKNFCSTLVCEFLMRIGRMLEKEIETRGIKTVNDTVISTVISHYHIVCGVDEKLTIDFIKQATSKYYSYVANRQETRKNSKKEEPKGDLPYAADK